SDLNPDTDADKIDAKNKEIAQIRQKAQKNDNSIKQLQDKRNLYQTQLTDINTQISITCDKITENDTNLKSKVKELNNKIEQEQKSLKQDIENYKSQIETLQAAQNYAIEQIIQDNAANYIPEDYEDEDTSNFSYDAAQLKQTWAKKAPWLTDGFYNKATEVSKRVGCDPNVLLAIMDSESGLKPSVQNKRGGASGLIQFMPLTARALGTTTDEIRKMSAEQQLVYVEKCLLANKKMAGFAANDKLDAGTMYALVFLPAYAKREVLALKGHKYYNCNAGLDLNGDGAITKQDLGARVRKRIPKG
ncbi:MAG: transglycosylase SLT domain-containing protein, partial [Candidatus Gastranaerophilaceae bacterium]